MPYGFICGFPVRSGDLYGGNLYGRSAQRRESLQALAAAAAAARWGDGNAGREVICHAVCKGKYQPFDRAGNQMYGCFRHSAIRKRRIDRAGMREGWESFDQWAAGAAGSSPKAPERTTAECAAGP